MRTPRVSIFMFSSVLAVVVAFTVQDSFDVKVSDPNLLSYTSVQRELKMSAQQVTDVSQAEARYKDHAKQTNRFNSDDERKEVLRFLDGGQLKRLREISLQTAGPIVLLADFVAERVGADKAKQRELHQALDSVVKEVTKPMEEEISKMANDLMRGVGDDPAKAEIKGKEVDKQANRISAKYNDRINDAVETKAPVRILAVLTRAQSQTWTDLLGRPFPVKQFRKNFWSDER